MQYTVQYNCGTTVHSAVLIHNTLQLIAIGADVEFLWRNGEINYDIVKGKIQALNSEINCILGDWVQVSQVSQDNRVEYSIVWWRTCQVCPLHSSSLAQTPATHLLRKLIKAGSSSVWVIPLIPALDNTVQYHTYNYGFRYLVGLSCNIAFPHWISYFARLSWK